MNWREELPYLRASAILVTKHGKGAALLALLRNDLGLRITTSIDIDTDRFGTFTGEVERKGSQLDAARAKIAEGFAQYPHARLAVASEGSFGPHPAIPFVAVGRELVLMVDRETGAEWTGQDISPQTNFSTTTVTDWQGALAFAERAKFPEHRLIVGAGGGKEPKRGLHKDLSSLASLEAAVLGEIDWSGSAFLETDMRADRNPTRMRAIERAGADLVRRFRSRCPACHYPGFEVTEWIAGLPCSLCGEPTDAVRSEVLTCRSCGQSERRYVAASSVADPGHCGVCNP